MQASYKSRARVGLSHPPSIIITILDCYLLGHSYHLPPTTYYLQITYIVASINGIWRIHISFLSTLVTDRSDIYNLKGLAYIFLSRKFLTWVGGGGGDVLNISCRTVDGMGRSNFPLKEKKNRKLFLKKKSESSILKEIFSAKRKFDCLILSQVELKF